MCRQAERRRALQRAFNHSRISKHVHFRIVSRETLNSMQSITHMAPKQIYIALIREVSKNLTDKSIKYVFSIAYLGQLRIKSLDRAGRLSVSTIDVMDFIISSMRGNQEIYRSSGLLGLHFHFLKEMVG